MAGAEAATAAGTPEEARARVLAAALPHVPFDGWTEATIRAASREAGVEEGLARLAFPRGGVDLALALHEDCDRRLAADLAAAPLATMRVREKIAYGVRRRLELMAPHREAARRAAALLALPIHAPDAARSVWRAADTIWTGIGDASEDYNWYTKRMTLGGLYGAVALYWLGDETPGQSATWSFLDRRIADVMRFEKAKAAIEASPLGRLALWGPKQVLKAVRPPRRSGAAETGTGVGLPG